MTRGISLIALGLVLAAHAASAGVFYAATNRTTGDQAASAADWQVTAWVDGDNAKIEFQSSDNAMLPAGSYLLTNDGGQTVLLVNEAEGTYSRWDLEAMMGMVGGILGAEGGMLSIELSNLSVDKLSEESAGSLLGYSAKRYEYRTSYDMQLKVLGMKRSNQVEINQEIWSTRAIDDAAALGFWLRKEPPSLGNEGFDELLRAEMSKVDGFPLKTVTATTTTAAKGKSTTQTAIMEVTELRRESIDPATFALDPSLVEQPMPMMDMGEEEEEEGGLRGLLRRGRDGN
jgi:hypothetical protein